MEREDSPAAAVEGSGDEQDAHNSDKEEKYHRHSFHQIAILEEAFMEWQHPGVNRRSELAEELGLKPKQVKFWFQNKRTQIKALSERSVNHALRLENERIKSENSILRGTLKNVRCLSCTGQTSWEEDSVMQNLWMENTLLLQEHERLSKLLASTNGINPTLPFTLPSSHDPSGGILLNQITEIPGLNQQIPILAHPHNQQIPILAHPHNQHIPILTSVINQDIPTLIPVLDQNISAITPAPDRNIPALTLPAHDQDISTLTSSAIDQDFVPFISALDQDSFAHDEDIPALDLDFDAVHEILDDYMWPQPVTTVTVDTEKTLMTERANAAVDELTRLLRMNEPFWFRSILDGRFILQRETYEKIFHRFSCLKGPHARIESSKDSRIVNMSGTQLVHMFLNPDKWVDLFPTIVKNAKIIQVFESGSLGSQHGALQLMNAEMHILSPMIPTREFNFLRCCKQIEVGVWTIADFSFDSSKHDASLSHTWRFPSGCIIQEITDGSCMVSWVEHVEVDDKIQPDHLFGELICDHSAFGAERWLLTLERMCERITRASLETIPNCDTGRVINSVEGRRSVMLLAHRMIKTFGRTLNMFDNKDFSYLTNVNIGGVRVCVRNNTEPGMPRGMIVSAVTSFWLPHSPQKVFDFLKYNGRRLEWDVLCNENPVQEIQRISTGTDLDNCITILRPFIPKENDMLILQESYADPLESLLVYAPIDIATLNIAIRGEDSSPLPLLPSGFTISGDGRSNAVAEQYGQVGKSGGSLITLVYQILMTCSQPAIEKQGMEYVAFAKTLVTSAVEKIKVALNCSN